MKIITSQKLFDKYPGHQDEINALLKALTTNVVVLPMPDYMGTKMECAKTNESILIVGNDDVIPFPTLPNPAQDPDNIVWSDNAYAAFKDQTCLMPDKIIARIPDEMLNPSFDYLKTVLTNQAVWMTKKTSNTGWYNIVTQAWVNISNYMKNQFQMNDQNIAPPTNPSSTPKLETIKKFAYVNLHGAQQTPYYYGQNGSTYPIAVEPTAGNFAGCLMFIEACYGGYVLSRDKELSTPMMALYSNAVGTISSTTVAYGPAAAPPQAADLLAQCFYNRIIAGDTLGQALLTAKQDFATQTIKNFGSLNGASRKTLLQFHLYGNPDIKL